MGLSNLKTNKILEALDGMPVKVDPKSPDTSFFQLRVVRKPLPPFAVPEPPVPGISVNPAGIVLVGMLELDPLSRELSKRIAMSPAAAPLEGTTIVEIEEAAVAETVVAIF
jgi:hypothetical protein